MKYPLQKLFALGLLSIAALFSANAKDISQQDLVKQMASEHKPLLIDVRTAGEYNKGHIPGAINIAHKEVEDRLSELLSAKNQNIVLYCRSGMRAGVAKRILEKNGFSKLDHLKGDFLAWQESGLPIEKLN